jgi:hypothetical protein
MIEVDDVALFAPGDATDLAHKIEWACTYPVQAREVLRRGRRIYERHRWQNERQVFVKLVHGLVEVPPPGELRWSSKPNSSTLQAPTQVASEKGLKHVPAGSAKEAH